MLRMVMSLTTIAATAFMLSSAANAQLRSEDAGSLEEVLKQHLTSPYYGSTSEGYGRAQRPYVDQVPQLLMSGNDPYTDVKYFRTTGKILTDSYGMTIYATARDTDFKVSSLTSDDLERWRPIVVPEGISQHGAWGTAWNEALGAWVLTFADKPLYRFRGDEEPGQANGVGNGFYTLEVIG